MAGALVSESTLFRIALRLTLPESAQKNEADAAPLGEIDYLLIVAGNSDEENPYRKGSAVQVRFSRFPLFEPSLTKARETDLSSRL